MEAQTMHHLLTSHKITLLIIINHNRPVPDFASSSTYWIQITILQYTKIGQMTEKGCVWIILYITVLCASVNTWEK